MIKVPFSSTPPNASSPHDMGKLPGDFIIKKCRQLLPERAKRKEHCPERSAVDFEVQGLEGLSAGESSLPRKEPATSRRGESKAILPAGSWTPDPGRTQSSWKFTQCPQSLPKLELTGRAQM